MTINAGRYKVELRELSWWDEEELKAAMANGAKMKEGQLSGVDGAVLLDVKIKRFKKAIVSIKEGEKETSFSEEWLKNLTSEEGEAISEAVESQPKKK
jgi:hypothetical protein